MKGGRLSRFGLFSLKRGHGRPELERVVEENERFAVGEKFGEAGEVAEKLDPRFAARVGHTPGWGINRRVDDSYGRPRRPTEAGAASPP